MDHGTEATLWSNNGERSRQENVNRDDSSRTQAKVPYMSLIVKRSIHSPKGCTLTTKWRTKLEIPRARGYERGQNVYG